MRKSVAIMVPASLFVEVSPLHHSGRELNNSTDPTREVPADGPSGDSTAPTSPGIPQGGPGSFGPQQGPLNQLPEGQAGAVHQNGQPSASEAIGNQQLPPDGSMQSGSQGLSAQGWGQQQYPYASGPALPGSEGFQPAGGYQSAGEQPFVQGSLPQAPYPAQLPPGAAQSGYQAHQQGWASNYQQTGYQQGPTSGYQQSGGPSGAAAKSPGFVIAVVVGTLLLVGGGMLAYFLLNRDSSTPSAPVTTVSPSSRSASPSSRSASPSPSAASTASPAPSQGGGGLLATRTLDEIVYPQKIGSFEVDTPVDDRVATYVSRAGGEIKVVSISKRKSTTLDQDTARLTQAESFPGGVCGKYSESGVICSLGAKDGVLAIIGTSESAAELKVFALEAQKAMQGS